MAAAVAFTMLITRAPPPPRHAAADAAATPLPSRRLPIPTTAITPFDTAIADATRYCFFRHCYGAILRFTRCSRKGDVHACWHDISGAMLMRYDVYALARKDAARERARRWRARSNAATRARYDTTLSRPTPTRAPHAMLKARRDECRRALEVKVMRAFIYMPTSLFCRR